MSFNNMMGMGAPNGILKPKEVPQKEVPKSVQESFEAVGVNAFFENGGANIGNDDVSSKNFKALEGLAAGLVVGAAVMGDKKPMSRRGFLGRFGGAVAASAILSGAPNVANAKRLNTSNGLIEVEKVHDLEYIFSSGSIKRSDYYFPDILSSRINTKFIQKRINDGVQILKDIPVVLESKVFESEFKLDLPVSQEIKEEAEKAKDNNHNPKGPIRKVVGNGLIVETVTVKGLGWVILPPGTLIAKIDKEWCILSCLNPISNVSQKKCPPCKD